MCMITYTPGGIEIPFDGIIEGATYNNDGHGWAVASRDGLEVGKSMDAATALVAYEEARKRHGKSSLGLFHSRFGTHGIMGPFNVHPFYVDDDQETVVAHNGILPSMFHPVKGDQRSDTRVFVDRVLRPMRMDNGIPSRRMGKRLGDQIGLGNKLTFLTVKGGVPKARIINAFLGEWDGANWFSNTGYLPSKWGSYYSGKTYTWDPKGEACGAGVDEDWQWEDWAKCKLCLENYMVDPETDVCDHCDFCNGCMTTYQDCMCYRGSHHTTPSEKWAIESKPTPWEQKYSRPYSWERD